jgi:exodeoxyribonuclease-5
MTDLTPSQEAAVSQALDFALGKSGSGRERFAVSGLAGTGKTTTLVQLVEQLQLAGLRVAVCAPTGKAATVINSKQQVFTAQTIHSCFMKSVNSRVDMLLKVLDEIELEKRQGQCSPAREQEYNDAVSELDRVQKTRKGDLTFGPIEPEIWLENYDIAVFDESSMIGEDVQVLYEQIDCKKIFFGDSSQLLPVGSQAAIDLMEADVHLKEILRQAGDSFIIPLSHTIAKHGRYPARKDFFGKPGVTAISNNDPELALRYGTDHQIIVWKNKTRHFLNSSLRPMNGFDPSGQKFPYFPMPGEKLMIAKNVRNQKLTSGDYIEIIDVAKDYYDATYYDNPFILPVTCRTLSDGALRSLDLDIHDLIESYDPPTGFSSGALYHRLEKAKKSAITVIFPYTITCHKAQGSEWPNVYVCGEYPTNSTEWRKWAYTAVTRARNQLVIGDKAIR